MDNDGKCNLGVHSHNLVFAQHSDTKTFGICNTMSGKDWSKLANPAVDKRTLSVCVMGYKMDMRALLEDSFLPRAL